MTSDQVPPRHIMNDAPHCIAGNAKHACEVPLAMLWVQRTDGPNLVVSQLCPRPFRALRIALWMSLRAATALAHAIDCIGLGCAKKEMVRVATTRGVTVMAHEEASSDRATAQQVGDAMRTSHLAVDSDGAISLPCSSPRPTSQRPRRPVYFLPKAFFDRAAQSAVVPSLEASALSDLFAATTGA